jgi:alpha-D-ribose 1-methylphosphonate 5-triphosphate synthase subunit PhnH
MIEAAFSDPVLAAQATFRAVLDATARPGTVARLTQPLTAPSPLAAGVAAIALALCDQDTSVWLDPGLRGVPAVAEWLRFHTGARIVENPGTAAFALLSSSRDSPPFDRFNVGTLEYPDRSTTVVLQAESFRKGPSFTVTGPGIRVEQKVQITPLPSDMGERLAANRRLFPRGIDLLFATETEIMALPRAVHVLPGSK